MMANKNPESQHRLETSGRPEEPLNKPLSSWALEVVSSLRQEEPREGLGTADQGPAGRQTGQMEGRRGLWSRWWRKFGRRITAVGWRASHTGTAVHTHTRPERQARTSTRTRAQRQAPGKTAPPCLIHLEARSVERTPLPPAHPSRDICLPPCFRCPWRPPRPCSSACWSWWSLETRVNRQPSQAATCTVSNPGSRELADWAEGQAAPRGTQ